jgi:hypothetical protein
MRQLRREPLSLVDGLLSDALKERYGTITARVLRHDAREREAHLIDSQGVTRTYSVTFLSNPMPAPLRPLNDKIRAGRLMGETFRDLGFAIRKNVFDIFVVESPPWLRKAFRTRERYAWARLFEFHARKGSSPPLVYATLCEIFTPDFKPPLVTPTDVSWLNPCTPALLACGVSREEAWRQINRLEDGRDVNGRFIEGRIATLPLAFELRSKVAKRLASP